MADQQRSDPHRWDPTVQHYAAVGEPITTPYCLDALAGLDLHPGGRLLDAAAGPGRWRPPPPAGVSTNYKARREAGLWIASNRVEKFNDWSIPLTQSLPDPQGQVLDSFVEKSVFSGHYWIDKCAEAFYPSH